MMQSWFSIKNAVSADQPAIVSIHDEIGSWGVSARDFLSQIRNIDTKTPIKLSLHSPGGEVFDGLAIYHALKSRGNVDVRIEGLAASMASVIAMAGRSVEMPRNAYMMIHNPNGVAVGNSADMRQLADLLDKLKASLVSAYREKTKKTDEDLSAMMDSETWLTGDEAYALGFADIVTDEIALSATAFKTARSIHSSSMLPKSLFDTQKPTPVNNSIMNNAFIALARKTGINIDDSASESEIVAAIENWNPPAKNIIIDFEDANVQAAFDARIASVTADHKAKLATMEAELAAIKALITNGAAAAAGGNQAVITPTRTPNATASIAEQFNTITDPAERTRFYNKHRSELGVSAFFNRS